MQEELEVHTESLPGGMTNAGAVRRLGANVLRPASPFAASIHSYLRAIRASGFEGVPMPVAIDADGQERLEFIEGDVPLAPYPAWSQSDAALASIAALLRGLHDAARSFDPSGREWSRALSDPVGGGLVCHNDLELSNIVFRAGRAVGFIDFEFAAPGRPIHDLAHLARLCVPLEHKVDRERMGWLPADHPARLRLIADSYGLDQAGRMALLPAIDAALDQIEKHAREGFEGQDAAMAEATARTGGIEKYDRRRRWWRARRSGFEAALLETT